MEIIIIGTEPPCPRCKETYERVKKVVKEKVSPLPVVRKIGYLSTEAQQLGKVGSAHEIAEWSGIPIDWDKVKELASGGWTPELDQLLMPLKEVAVKNGWIMTPAVVIDGKVVHFGSVPGMDELERMLVLC